MSTPNTDRAPPRRASIVLTALAAAVVIGFAAGYVAAAQPHMHNALDALQTARSELQLAAHNKGGHRLKAIELVEAAIAQVRRGIADGAE
jgi:hypothetical protein